VTAMSLELKVSGEVTPHARGNHLLKLAQMLMASAELWGLLAGDPPSLGSPRTTCTGGRPKPCGALGTRMAERTAVTIGSQDERRWGRRWVA
jgi:hypothetical protein